MYAKQNINEETGKSLQNAILSKFIEGNPKKTTLNVEKFQRIVLPYVLNELDNSNYTDIEIKA